MPSWYALVGPKGMNDKVRGKIAGAVQEYLNNPTARAKLAQLYLDPIPGTGPEFKARAQADAAEWARFIKENNLQAE